MDLSKYLTQASLRAWEGQNASFDHIDKINIYFYSTQAPTAAESSFTDQCPVHTHLRHHKTGMITRRHMCTYVKKEKIVNLIYRTISLNTRNPTNKASIYKQPICSLDAFQHVAQYQYQESQVNHAYEFGNTLSLFNI